ncbi:MAG: N-formylglutamate amidohydrolase, partial [Candidatus Dadabacteria bacterium]|nr:N-formylglutamate amidohydrolase [Candidatus Dadabacteria bacterium]
MEKEIFYMNVGNLPILATAIHNGNEVSKNVRNLFILNDSERLREEDPFTDKLAHVSDTRIVVSKSRFEVDMN